MFAGKPLPTTGVQLLFHQLCQATPQDNPSRTRALPRGKALGQRVRTRCGDCGDREAATKREMLKPSSV